MLLTILSLNKIEYKGEVAGLKVKTKSGEVTILSGHRPMVSVLEKCTAEIITKDNKKNPIKIDSGFLEMSEGNRLNVMIG